MSVKQKFIEWFTKNNNGCSPAMEDDRSFVHEKTRHMFEAYQAGVAEGEARCAALVAEAYDLKHPGTYLPSKRETPALDAFLAEVWAQGVEMAAKSEQFSTWVQQGLRSFAIGVRQGDDQ